MHMPWGDWQFYVVSAAALAAAWAALRVLRPRCPGCAGGPVAHRRPADLTVRGRPPRGDSTLPDGPVEGSS